MTVVVDKTRAIEIVRRLQAAYAQREGILEDVDDLVEHQLPAGVRPLSREHALFLTFTVVNDHGLKSRRLYDRAKSLYSARPGLFDPEEVPTIYSDGADERLMKDAVAPLGVRYPRVAAQNWFQNAIHLRDKYESDARHLFNCSKVAAKVLAAICDLRGYGPKTGGMLLRAAVGLGLTKLRGLEEVLLPVDIHDSRISFFVRILRDTELSRETPDYYAYAKHVQVALASACRTAGVSWLDVDRALWLIGSRGCVRVQCAFCPLRMSCSAAGHGATAGNGRVPKRGGSRSPTARRLRKKPDADGSVTGA